jgi:uncharacterized membrane protein
MSRLPERSSRTTARGTLSHGHAHDGTGLPAPVPVPVRALLAGATAVFGLLTVIAVIVLWPSNEPRPDINGDLASTENVDATITKVDTRRCGPVGECKVLVVRLDSGPDAGRNEQLPDLPTASTSADLTVGQRIVVSRLVQHDTGLVSYSFADVQRSQPLWILALLAAGAVVAIGRWRGLAAIAGLGVTWLVLTTFLIPGVLDGHNPVAMALTSGSIILFAVLYLAHGVSARTTTALLGTLVSLLLIGVLAAVFVGAAKLSGLASEEVTFLVASGIELDLAGLLLCAIIIGSLGALNDVTVTQASAVWELHAANPASSVMDLYRSGMRIGRDHIASTVDTLVLAYAGSSLPLLILFSLGERRFSDVITNEIVAEEVVRTLVGSIGLVASVPVTTALAAFAVTRARRAIPADEAVVEVGDETTNPVATT